MGEENTAHSSFPSIKAQDLALFSRKIQTKDNAWILENIPKNPKYLVTNSDYPTILQEGFHYNALHIAARWGNAEVVQLILSSVSDVGFIRRLYPDDNLETSGSRTRMLTDSYLNTPDKRANETPLHFACKFNCYEVVKLLLGHPLTKLKCTNDQGETAEKIIGTRMENTDMARKISALFRADTIIPIWRDRLGSGQPFVGKAVKFLKLGTYTPAPFLEPYGNILVRPLKPLVTYVPMRKMKLFKTDDDAIPGDSFENSWSIVAFAGPLDKSDAAVFRAKLKWKDTGYTSFQMPSGTPPARISTPTRFRGSPISVTPTKKFSRLISSNLTSTPTRNNRTPFGDENDSLNDSSCLEVQPIALTDPRSAGFVMLTPPRVGEIRAQGDSDSPKTPLNLSLAEDLSMRLSDSEKGLERVARHYAKEYPCKWMEYWSFLKKFVDLNSHEGLKALDDYLSAKERLIEPVEKEKFDLLMDDICKRIAGLSLEDGGYGDTSPVKTIMSKVTAAVMNMMGEEDESGFYDCFTYAVYIHGSSYSKWDEQLMSAIMLVDPKLLESFRSISIWYNTIKSSIPFNKKKTAVNTSMNWAGGERNDSQFAKKSWLM